MSNLAYLMTARSLGAPHPDRKGLQRVGRYQVPLFWLACIRPADVRRAFDEDNEVEFAYATLLKQDAIETFHARQEALDWISTGLRPWFAEWLRVLKGFNARCIKIDPTEVVDMGDDGPDEFERAVACFEQPTLEGFSAILSLTSLTDILDMPDRNIRPTSRPGSGSTLVEAGVYLMGYAYDEQD